MYSTQIMAARNPGFLERVSGRAREEGQKVAHTIIGSSEVMRGLASVSIPYQYPAQHANFVPIPLMYPYHLMAQGGERQGGGIYPPVALSPQPSAYFTTPGSAGTEEQDSPQVDPLSHSTQQHTPPPAPRQVPPQHPPPPVKPASRHVPPQHTPPVTTLASMPLPPQPIPPPMMIPASGWVPYLSATTQTIREKNFAEMGLGKALDATNPHPWASKSPYQAKEVQVNDLVITTEGPNMKHFTEIIEDYFNVQGGLESSMQLLHQPVKVGVAADVHRSRSEIQEMRGKTVSTRTISFPVSAVGAQEGLFQSQLRQHKEQDREQTDETKLCLDFLHKLGGITHYVSSITLGAMEYSVSRVQTLDVGSKVNCKGGFGHLATANATLRVSKKLCKGNYDEEKIGRIRNGQVAPNDEAVINFSITPLADLVLEDESLRKSMQEAIQTYISARLHKRNGPYHIVTPEKTLGGRNIYWKVEVSDREGEVRHFIKHTQNKQDASNFYIRPDYKSTCRYFFITTCDEPKKSTATLQSEQEEGVERYVHIDWKSCLKHLPGNARVELTVKAAVKPDFARFQLIDRRDRQPKALLESDWLPDEPEDQGEPFFLGQYYHISKCLSVTGINSNQRQPSFMLCRKSQHSEAKCHMLFQLVRPDNATLTARDRGQ